MRRCTCCVAACDSSSERASMRSRRSSSLKARASASGRTRYIASKRSPTSTSSRHRLRISTMWSDWRTATGAAESHVALLGLGTNIGDRTANLGAAVQGIGALGRIDALSRVYDSEPFGDTDQPRFLNMALRLRTSLAPSDLLHELKQLEQRMGRTPTHRMGPRIIDIDILFYDDIRLD